jgi:ABC-type multidrug transport system ATPase subunit
MRARVGFSIATAVDPDILLLDEVLQTGDNKFKQKSRERIAEVLKTAKAVVMVTHDMSWITAFCTRAILLDKGQIVAEGDPDEIADLHEQDAEKRQKQKRKAKQLIKHGKVDVVDLNQARKEGTLGELLDGKEEEAAELERAAELDRAANEASKAPSSSGAAGSTSRGAAGSAGNGAPSGSTSPKTTPRKSSKSSKSPTP